jgi:hypothetical protein
MKNFLNNPVALIKNNEVSEVVYMLDRDPEDIKKELDNHEYDDFVFFNDYGSELFVGQQKVDDEHFAFLKPYPSWVFNKDILSWEAPITRPTDGKPYVWSESLKNWHICTEC